jgi:DNA-binding transcriptional LysR family regulator
MDLRKLEIFVQVAQLENFTRAASSLHMAQPAVSIAIRKLEEELDTRLFDRSGRRAHLTAEGYNLLQRAESILRDVEDLKHASSAMKNLLQGELSIACPSMLATYFLPDLLSGFLREHPGLQASVTQAGTTRVEQMLMEDEIEIGVTTSHDPGSNPDLDLVPLISQQMVLCMAQDHPWANRRHIRVKDLDGAPMMVYESGYFIRSTLDQLCSEHDVTPDYRMQSNFLPLLTRMVKQGLGTTVGLKVMAEEEAGITGVPLSPRTDVGMALAKRRGRSISRANQAFLDWVAFTL